MTGAGVVLPPRRLHHRLLDLIFPPRCVGCARPGAWICERCWPRVPWLATDQCIQCAAPLGSAKLCPTCLAMTSVRRGGTRTNVTAVARFDGVARQAVHDLKYRGHHDIATVLGPLMAQRMPRSTVLLIPVPLHWLRRRSRGYNQSELLARNAGRALGVRVDGKSLRRYRNTGDQVRLDAAARQVNVAGAFRWTGGRLSGPALLWMTCTRLDPH